MQVYFYFKNTALLTQPNLKNSPCSKNNLCVKLSN
jgi:hypothetical protein